MQRMTSDTSQGSEPVLISGLQLCACGKHSQAKSARDVEAGHDTVSLLDRLDVGAHLMHDAHELRKHRLWGM